MTTADRLMTTKEVAIMCKLSHRTLENFRRVGQGPPYLKIGRSIRYVLADVIRWLTGGKA